MPRIRDIKKHNGALKYENIRSARIKNMQNRKNKMIVNDYGVWVAKPPVTVPERVLPTLSDAASRPTLSEAPYGYYPKYVRFPDTCSGQTQNLCGCQTKRKQAWCSDFGAYQFNWDAVGSTMADFMVFY